MLLAIAVGPLWVPLWWERNSHKLLVGAVLGAPVVVLYLFRRPAALGVMAEDYVSFIVLLAGLYAISAGIRLTGDLEATPLTNTSFLAIGSALASFIGTTGASMLLIRPLLQTNRERRRVKHTVIFFTFLVGNVGGMLTPLGDPPLFLGYLQGVPFTWTFRLWPQWLLLTVALAAVVLAVAFLHAPWRELAIVALAAISLWRTPAAIRRANGVTAHPIIEVAVLFFGIFVTMIPALELLRVRGGELGVREPWQFFWVTGALSSFLDNAPTYLTFLALAQGLRMTDEVVGVTHVVLGAISVGAVAMGANSYIGNAPNFMVKSIAEAAKVPMPSFFGYMLYSAGVLVPLFVVVTLLFFR
ncbi:MAG: sodium:proton antiporter [Candidatus Rokuibacteriota bacterium]|nr:MAG: sodium:proton antiporter [Candidatus Rokubacteria bacterium]